MLKQLTRKLFILSALVACLMLAVPSTPAQGSGYWLSGKVVFNTYAPVVYPGVGIYKWNGSSWVFQGYANLTSCNGFSYDTGGPGFFLAQVNGTYGVDLYGNCGWIDFYTYMEGGRVAQLSAGMPSAYMDITTR